LLLLLIAATAEFGRYFQTYSTLARATRISARYLSDKILNNDALTAGKNVAVCGLNTACNTPAVTGLTVNNVSIATTGTQPFYETVTVSITYNYQSVFNLGNWVGSSWTTVPMNASTTMRYLL
jgi:Flp pilus assembly protein TadG